jgi:hypothetical protein
VEQNHKQEKLFQRFFSFDHGIDKTNRWVVLADKIPWVEIEEKYCYLFMQGGKPAFSIRVGLGSLIIKEKLNITDEKQWLRSLRIHICSTSWDMINTVREGHLIQAA